MTRGSAQSDWRARLVRERLPAGRGKQRGEAHGGDTLADVRLAGADRKHTFRDTVAGCLAACGFLMMLT